MMGSRLCYYVILLIAIFISFLLMGSFALWGASNLPDAVTATTQNSGCSSQTSQQGKMDLMMAKMEVLDAINAKLDALDNHRWDHPCTHYIVHDNSGDGFGHQLLDMISGMVLHYLHIDGVCYLPREPYTGNSSVGHGCTSCIEAYNAIHAKWLSRVFVRPVDQSLPRKTFTNVWGRIKAVCREPITKNHTNPRCDAARYQVSQLLKKVALELSYIHAIPQLDVAIHIRKGDRSVDVSNAYFDIIDGLFQPAKGKITQLDVFTEHPGEAEEFYHQFNKSQHFEVVEHYSEDALRSWLLMANARVLFVHQSSFSTSAARASIGNGGQGGILFSQKQKPQEGRYDGMFFACPAKAGWWMSFGHGTTSCPTERMEKVQQMIRGG